MNIPTRRISMEQLQGWFTPRNAARGPEMPLEGAEDPVCATCAGRGEVDRMEAVYDGEPHTAWIGSGPCPECSDSHSRDVDRDEE